MSATVYLVGIGPGQPELVTPEALAAIKKVSVVIGQPECLELVEEPMPRATTALTYNVY